MSAVSNFYSGKSVLITGASGFLGRVIVEKMLRSLPEVKLIYCIIRPQNGVEPQQRLKKILASELFDLVRERHADRLQKVVAVAGNLMEPDMGLTEADSMRLCDEVSIVLHCAATVKFDEPLRISVEMNVVGTQRLIALCHKMRKLTSVVHASTAYANCDRSRTVESVYPPPIQPQRLIEALEWMTDDMVLALTPHLVGRRPNTYTLTKALTEFMLVEESSSLPLTIVRPSIIGAIWKEPLPGWKDNFNGPTGIFAGVAKGIITNMIGDASLKTDIIPVDIVSNLMIVAAWHRATHTFDSIPVIHCTSGELNPMLWRFVLNFLGEFYLSVPINEPIRVPSTALHTNRRTFQMATAVSNVLPAYVMDLFCRMTGRKVKYVRMYSKILNVQETLHYFTSHEWEFQAKNMPEMWHSLSAEDQELFNFDVRQVDWREYLFDYMLGVKKYLMKESLDDLPAARANLSRMQLWGTLGRWAAIFATVELAARRQSRQRKSALFCLFVGISQLMQQLFDTGVTLPRRPGITCADNGKSTGSNDADGDMAIRA